jgi:nicotinamide phosphoribosyltransferase
MTTKVLPSRRYHQTPRPLWSDAYTINGSVFESAEATEYSKYYGAFRKFPYEHEPFYDKVDQRILFAGLQSLCDMLFYDPITHAEIDETIAFLAGRKAKNDGTFENWEFPEALWRRVVNEFGGFLPLRVTGLPEGSVVYPHEPFMRVEATEPGFGPLVPWFESTLLHVWAASERLTAARHFMKHSFNVIRSYEPATVTDDECMFFARLMIHDFGDRAATSPMESELVSKVHNYVWFGTDTFRSAYQNWKNGAPAAFGSSVKALAHRIVQGYAEEAQCYNSMYETAGGNEFLSMVGDCYDYWNALETSLIPLALKAKADTGGKAKTIVARPDSGDSVEMVVGTLQRADKAGLMAEHLCADGVTRKVSTTLRFIVGNGEDFASVIEITNAALKAGFVPWRCGIFGIGGHLRNNINRDHLSTKFALCEVGASHRPVIKLSNTPGKQTLPECKVLRDEQALESGVTLSLPTEMANTPDALVVYYDGSKAEPFGPGFTDDFLTCENRVVKEFENMPKTAGARSQELQREVDDLIKHYRR